jgi:hypothetical protein
VASWEEDGLLLGFSCTHGDIAYPGRSSSSSCSYQGVGTLVDTFRSHTYRSLYNGLPWFLLPLLPNSHPHLLTVYPLPTNEAMTTESQRYNCWIRNGGNAIPKHACPETKGSNTPLDLPFSGPVTHSGDISVTVN